MVMARTFTGKLDLLALHTADHGPTAAAQSITGIAGWRHPGMPGNVSFVAEPNQYRGIFGPGTQPYLGEIDRTIATATNGKVAGIFVESTQGYGGIIEMPPGYMSGAAERVRAAGGCTMPTKCSQASDAPVITSGGSRLTESCRTSS